MGKTVNRNDVAKRAGVAPSTVSNVINGTKFVSEDVKQRVLRAIAELEYEFDKTGYHSFEYAG